MAPATMPPFITSEAAMGTKMTFTARAELTNVVRRRYLAAAGAEKRRILDEFIAVYLLHRSLKGNRGREDGFLHG